MAFTISYLFSNIKLRLFLPSEIISLNHKPIEYITFNILINIIYWKNSNPCINKTVEVVSINNDILVYIGQGEGNTK